MSPRESEEVMVSIIIPNFNGELFIEKLFLSLHKQTFKNFEVIFVDNKSTDNSLSCLKKVMKRINFNNRVKIIENERNLGYCKACNIGLNYAKGKYVVFLNNDTYLSKKWLEELIKAFEKRQSIGVCQSKIIHARTFKLASLGTFMDVYGRPYEVNFLPKAFNGFKDFLINFSFYAGGQAIVIPKEILIKVGGYDNKLFYGDRDLCWRIRLLGYDIAIALNSVCFHYGGYTTKTIYTIKERIFHEYKDRIRVICKNYSCKRLLKRTLVALILIFLEAIGLSIYYRKFLVIEPMRALCWNLKNLRDTIITRKSSQAKRKINDALIERYMIKQPIFILLFKKYLLNRLNF